MNKPQLLDQLKEAKELYAQFVNPHTREDSHKFERRANIREEFKTLSDRMKKLLLKTFQWREERDEERFIRDIDEKLHTLSTKNPKDEIMRSRASLSTKNVLQSWYTLSYDQELQSDFWPYYNDLCELSLSSVERPSAKNPIAAKLAYILNFPKRRLVTELLPQELIDYAAGIDTREYLKGALRTGKVHSSHIHPLQPAISKALLDYVTWDSYTTVLLANPDIWRPFTEGKRHEIFNNIFDGVIKAELEGDSALKYTVLGK